eukprot:scaffold1954_cov33-Attheya_sp.AAC.2
MGISMGRNGQNNRQTAIGIKYRKNRGTVGEMMRMSRLLCWSVNGAPRRRSADRKPRTATYWGVLRESSSTLLVTAESSSSSSSSSPTTDGTVVTTGTFGQRS